MKEARTKKKTPRNTKYMLKLFVLFSSPTDSIFLV